MMTPFAPLPGYPFAQGLDPQGDLVVLTSDGNFPEFDPDIEGHVLA